MLFQLDICIGLNLKSVTLAFFGELRHNLQRGNPMKTNHSQSLPVFPSTNVHCFDDFITIAVHNSLLIFLSQRGNPAKNQSSHSLPGFASTISNFDFMTCPQLLLILLHCFLLFISKELTYFPSIASSIVYDWPI